MKDSSFWEVTVPRVMSSFAVSIFVMLWVGLALAVMINLEWLDLVWNWVGSLPAMTEIIVWVVFLPIMVGLWIWESAWSTFATILALAGMIGWTLLAVSSFVKAVRSGSSGVQKL